jgi:glutamate/tyrosine decarboxylase-like PLP-dependent enzyme
VQQCARDVATHLSAQIAELGPFELLTRGDELPVFAFKLRDTISNYTVFDVSNALRGTAGCCRRTRSRRTGRTSPRFASS